MPPEWLAAHPDLDLPDLREAAAVAPVMNADDAFEHHVDAPLGTVRSLMQKP